MDEKLACVSRSPLITSRGTEMSGRRPSAPPVPSGESSWMYSISTLNAEPLPKWSMIFSLRKCVAMKIFRTPAAFKFSMMISMTTAIELQQRLGGVVSERPQARAEAAGHDDRLHRRRCLGGVQAL